MQLVWQLRNHHEDMGGLIIADYFSYLRNGEIGLIIAKTNIVVEYPRDGRNSGSCLSYGHSCWGAHGKRSDAPTMPILTVKSLLSGSPQNIVAPSSQAQLILSRLIARQQPVLPLMDKNSVRWNDSPNYKTFIQSKWDTALLNDDDTISNRISINNENENNKRKISNAQGIMRNMNEKLENIPEILLLLTDEYDKPINNPRKLDILKFLNEEDGNTK